MSTRSLCGPRNIIDRAILDQYQRLGLNPYRLSKLVVGISRATIYSFVAGTTSLSTAHAAEIMEAIGLDIEGSTIGPVKGFELPAIAHQRKPRDKAVPWVRCVYFIQDGDSGPIKIGFTRYLRKRFAQLCNASSRRMRVLGFVLNGDLKLEREIHERFSGSRIQGEWFSPSPDIDEFINANCQRIALAV